MKKLIIIRFCIVYFLMLYFVLGNGLALNAQQKTKKRPKIITRPESKKQTVIQKKESSDKKETGLSEKKGFSANFSRERWQTGILANGSYFINSEVKDLLKPGFGGQLDFFFSPFFFATTDVGLAVSGHFFQGQSHFSGQSLYFMPMEIIVRWRFLNKGTLHRPWALYASLGQGISYVASSIGSSSVSYTTGLHVGFQWKFSRLFSLRMEIGGYYLTDPVLVTPLNFQLGVTYHWKK